MRTTKVSATYTYYAPETMSIEEAKRIALDRAKIQAIADEFGTIVSQNTSTVITNKDGKSDTRFFAFGESDVKGEWIETIGNPVYNLKFEKHFFVVECSVIGKARETTKPKIEYIAQPLRNGTTLKYASTYFQDGDDLYLYFTSPIDGFLSVYLLVETTQTVYSILPYKSENNAAIPIVGKKEYVFFSIQEADKKDRGKVDEYILSCDLNKEFNTLFIVFSPTQFFGKNGFESNSENAPNCISFKEFKQWLTKAITKDNNIQTTQISISINK